jgi:5-methylcytosine-specific restriction enzyme subunit McrC
LKRPNYIKEFGVISEGAHINYIESTNELVLDNKSFGSLVDFVEENQLNPDFEKAFTVFKKRGVRCIRVKNYVGVIETTDGVVVEILPKTFKQHENRDASIEEARSILFKMLKSLKNSPFINLSNAHIGASNNFPILEVFITNYIVELEKLLNKQLKGDYITTQDNIKYLRGKLKVKENLKFNSIDKSKFYCEFDFFDTNTPPNKLIKSCLLKLMKSTVTSKNKNKINKILSSFGDIDSSKDFISDFSFCDYRKRILINYSKILEWSRIFLDNKSFTNFHGKSVNQAVLFPMEKLFESYVAHLLKKHFSSIEIKTQDKRYFLLSQKKNINDDNFSLNKFQLKPDIVINDDKVIIDTKWKILNQENNKFDIKESDVYQMHAYGRRYQDEHSGVAPRMALIYPKSSKFLNKLNQFRYGGNLLLDVYPFDFFNNSKDEISLIINELLENKELLDPNKNNILNENLYHLKDDSDINIAADFKPKYGN